MLKVFICEDHPNQRANLETLIAGYINALDFDMQIACSTPSPAELLAKITPHPSKAGGLYFLDLDLAADIDGFKLALEIRRQDPRGFIAIVTGDAASQMLTFKYAVEAMDYIVKGEPDFAGRVEKCLQTANNRYVPDNYFEIKLAEDTLNDSRFISKGSIVRLTAGEILYVATIAAKPHYVAVCTRDCKYITRLHLNDAEKKLCAAFLRSEVSCIVNTACVRELDRKAMKLCLTNGEYVNISRRHLKKWQELIK